MYPALTSFSGDLFADFDSLRRQLEQLMGIRRWPSSIRAAGRGAFPAINVGTTEDAVEIYAFAPGIDVAKLEVSVDKGLLTLSGERAVDLPEEDDKMSVYARERFAGTFKRVVSLPENVDSARVDAAYRNGVLRIAIPKHEAAKPRRVEVKSH